MKVIETPWAKAGIEQVTAQTTEKPVKTSKGAPELEPAAERVFEKKIKSGLEMKIPREGEPM
jgi:hypothetical protein